MREKSRKRKREDVILQAVTNCPFYGIGIFLTALAVLLCITGGVAKRNRRIRPPPTQAALAATLSDRINASSYNNVAASAAQSCCGA
jgi:hypothetical protein